jgi:hypothetical protein
MPSSPVVSAATNVEEFSCASAGCKDILHAARKQTKEVTFTRTSNDWGIDPFSAARIDPTAEERFVEHIFIQGYLKRIMMTRARIGI